MKITATPFSTAPDLPLGAPAAARTVFGLLSKLQHGSLSIELPDGSSYRFGPGGGPSASLMLRNWNVFGASLRSGDIGFARSYIDGDWTTPRLAELLEFVLANRQALDAAIHGHWLGRLLYRIKHLLNRNTRANARDNILAHYDLGNAFYELWLDESMNYSAALFDGDAQDDLHDAQVAKVRRALCMARVKPGDRVLEIGFGWGALAELATTEFGASLIGVTLSVEQLDWASRRMVRLGTASRTNLRLQDYRDIDDGPYDAICSIEMIEAVGRDYWPEYFRIVHQSLRSGGRACIQSIVIDDNLFERYVRSTDFIQQFIFPGGCLPCPREFRAAAAAAGLRVEDEFAFGKDYARTCRIWRESFIAHRADVLALGFDERFIRTWEFYLAYCEAGFARGDIDVMQYTLVKP